MVNAQGVSFGSYNPFATIDLAGAGNIAVSCDLGLAYTITISAGRGTYAMRTMANGAYSLTYNLYTDPGRLLVWGDGTGATATAGRLATGVSINVPVYGRIHAGQNIGAGNYRDEVIVTVNF